MSSFWDFFTGKKSTAAASADHAPVSRTESGRRGRHPAAGTSVPPPEPPAPPAPKPKPKLRYGIDDAIKLMRTVPVDDNAELVVRVIRKTLESLNVKLDDIVEDAGTRQDLLRGGIADHRKMIAQLELEIGTRKGEIKRLEGDLTETTRVRQRLELAQANQTQAVPAFVMPPGSRPQPEGRSLQGADGKSQGADSKTYSAEAKTPSAEAKTPSAEAKTHGAEGKTPSAEGKTPSAEAKTHGAEAKTHGAEGKTHGAEGKTHGADGASLPPPLPRSRSELPRPLAVTPTREPSVVSGADVESIPPAPTRAEEGKTP